jgi:hypothetical protein
MVPSASRSSSALDRPEATAAQRRRQPKRAEIGIMGGMRDPDDFTDDSDLRSDDDRDAGWSQDDDYERDR